MIQTNNDEEDYGNLEEFPENSRNFASNLKSKPTRNMTMYISCIKS